jgi:hypothetical protein
MARGLKRSKCDLVGFLHDADGVRWRACAHLLADTPDLG